MSTGAFPGSFPAGRIPALIPLKPEPEVPVFAVLALTAMTCGTPGSATAVHPSAPDAQLAELYGQGLTLEDFVAGARRRKDIWEENVAAAQLPADVAERMAALEGRGSWRLLVVAADWCLDSAHNIPPMDRLALFSDALALRVVTPETGGQAVMDARPTSDGRSATPTVVILDEAGNEVGCWIERPARQRAFYLANLKGVEEGSDAYNAAVRDFLGWYRSDNGATALRELLALLEAAAAGATGCVTPGA